MRKDTGMMSLENHRPRLTLPFVLPLLSHSRHNYNNNYNKSNQRHVGRAFECHRCRVGGLPGERRFGLPRYASAHSGRFALRTHRVLGLKSLIPIIISGVLAIYGLIIGVILVHKFEGDEPISDSDGCRYLAGGLLVGFACLSSGVGMGLFLQPPRLPPFPPTPPSPPTGATTATGIGGGEEAAPGHGGITEPLLSIMGPPPPPPAPHDGKGFVTMVLVFIFLEAIGLYGLIVALFAIGK